MGFEELSQGEPTGDGPAGPRPAAWIALAVVCLLAGTLFLVFRGPPEPSAAPPPTGAATAFPAPDGASDLTLVAEPPTSLTLGRICPAVTDGRKTLDVSFNLVNVSTTDVTLMDVEPVLPLGGLKVRGSNAGGGSCEHPGRQAPGGLMVPGATQLITLRFRLPKECPQPYPVQARIRLRVNQMVGTTTVPVYNDLGEISFDTCPVPDS